MTIDLEVFKELREALKFNVPPGRDVTKTGDAEFVYSLCTGFEDSVHSWYNRGDKRWWDYGAIPPQDIGYYFIDEVNFESKCWGIFQYKGKYYKAEWSYCKSASEMDYYSILDSLCEVKPVTKTITSWEAV